MSKRQRESLAIFPTSFAPAEEAVAKPPKKKQKRVEHGATEEDNPKGHQAAPQQRLAIKNGFRILPIHIGDTDVIKYWFFKEQKAHSHAGSQESDEEGQGQGSEDSRTLFVTNLAADCTEEDIRSVFERCGKIESVKFDSLAVKLPHFNSNKPQANNLQNTAAQLPSKGQQQLLQHRQQQSLPDTIKYPFESHGFALVVFAQQKGLLTALNGLTRQAVQDAREHGSANKGIMRLFEEYKSFYFQDRDALQESVDSYMKDYDKRKRQEKKLAEQLATQQDDDGWTVVVRRGKKRAFQSTGGKEATVGTASLSQEQLLQKKEKESDKLIENFYRFQKMEEKRQRLNELRRRFEQDKMRIAKIKSGVTARKFKPS